MEQNIPIITDKNFWNVINKRDLKKLSTYYLHDRYDSEGNKTQISKINSDAMTCATVLALYEKDIELIKVMDFPTRAVMERVADKPEQLELLLEIFKENKYKPSVPSYVWEKATTEAREIFKKYDMIGYCECGKCEECEAFNKEMEGNDDE